MIKTAINYQDIERIKEEGTRAFESIEKSSYKQKLVYKLLNLSKGNNQKEFFSLLLKVLNSYIDKNIHIRSFVEELKEIYPLSERDFEKISYTIIMAIMSSIKTEEKNKEV